MCKMQVEFCLVVIRTVGDYGGTVVPAVLHDCILSFDRTLVLVHCSVFDFDFFSVTIQEFIKHLLAVDRDSDLKKEFYEMQVYQINDDSVTPQIETTVFLLIVNLTLHLSLESTSGLECVILNSNDKRCEFMDEMEGLLFYTF